MFRPSDPLSLSIYATQNEEVNLRNNYLQGAGGAGAGSGGFFNRKRWVSDIKLEIFTS